MGFIDRLIWSAIGERVELLVDEIYKKREDKLAKDTLETSRITAEQLNKILETLRQNGNRPARAA